MNTFSTTLDQVSIIVGLGLIPFISLFGSVGNVISLRVLSRMRMRNVINPVLAALAVSDLTFLLHALFFSFLKLYRLRDPVAGAELRAITFPFLGAYSSVVTARITTGLTVMLSLERLVAVYFPMRARAMCNRTVTVAGIVLVYAVTILMFIPYMLKYRTERRTTFDNRTEYEVVRTALGKDPKFFPVYGTILNTLFRFLPLALLTVVNVLIALAIRRTWQLRQRISSTSGSYRVRSSGASAVGSGGGGRETGNGSVGGRGTTGYTRHNLRNSSYEQRRITVMLLVVSLVSLVCILPGAVHSIMSQAWAPDYSPRGVQNNLFIIMSTLTYFLETVNSSVNFIIYMAFSAKFKSTYRAMFCCGKDECGAAGVGSHGSGHSAVHLTNHRHCGTSGSCSGPLHWNRARAGLGSSSSSNRESYPLREHPR
ncbi:FMRFamide receptor-like [Elysia marginata]|uniref:FMRFamide receptor-like n=1 Tax=Elysia marginata TaxID=1093978 RepID=A0AAV4GJB0_9GAST|nr:FMRFamide receptor-like [Elysia marginata]